MPRTSRLLTAALAVLVAAGAMPGCRGPAANVWTPETGTVVLDEMPRGTPAERRLYATALIGAGKWRKGVAELRRQIAADPDAEWVPGARLVIARGLSNGGRHKKAFRELAGPAAQERDATLRARMIDQQFATARAMAREDARGACRLLNGMMDTARDDEEKARVLKEKGEVMFAAGHYLDADDLYLAVIEGYPRTTWVTYCKGRRAECHWRLACWLNIGGEMIETAVGSLDAFVRAYPDEQMTERIRRERDEARAALAENWRSIARFYADRRGRPWAAAEYLVLIESQFPDTRIGAWAHREMLKIEQSSRSPLVGTVRQVELPGFSAGDTNP